MRAASLGSAALCALGSWYGTKVLRDGATLGAATCVCHEAAGPLSPTVGHAQREGAGPAVGACLRWCPYTHSPLCRWDMLKRAGKDLLDRCVQRAYDSQIDDVQVQKKYLASLEWHEYR